MHDELLALNAELTDAWGRGIVTVLGGKPQGRPLRVPRPGEARPTDDGPAEDAPEGQRNDPQQVAAFFARYVNTS